MQLTQLQGSQPGQKVVINQDWQTVLIWSSDQSQFKHNWLPLQAATINSQWWIKTITPLDNQTPVIVNWEKIWKQSVIKHWDTISVWEWWKMIIASHKPWNLDANQVWSHLGTLDLSPEDIANITYRLFNINENTILKRPILAVAGLLIFLVISSLILFVKTASLNKAINEKSSMLSSQISEANDSISSLQALLWSTCDPNAEECPKEDNTSVTQKITLFKKDLASIQKNLTDMAANNAKAKDDINAIISDSLNENKIKAIEDKIAKSLTDWPIGKVTASTKDLEKKFSLLDDVLWQKVTEMNQKISWFAQYQDDFKSLGQVRNFMTVYSWDKAVQDKDIKLIKSWIWDIQKDIDGLKKKDDSTDLSFKDLNAQLDTLALKLKNLERTN